MKLPPLKEEKERVQGPQGGGRVPYTARGHRFRVQGPEPSSAGLKPGARLPCPWGPAAPEEGGGWGAGRVVIIAWTSTTALWLAWQKRREQEDTPVGTSILPAVQQRAAGIWGGRGRGTLRQVGGDTGS